MYTQLPVPTIFAHRGASAYAPENTLAAFELAVRQKADAIELDAKLSGDQHVVVFHDRTLDRTTDGSGKISDFPLVALKELDAGEHFDPEYLGERIPTLDEVFEAVGHKTFINIELTNYERPIDSLAEKTAGCVRRHNLADRILFSSFNPIVLRKIKKMLPEIPIGLLALPGSGGAWARSVLGRWVPYQALHPEHRDISHSLVDRCHRQKYRVYTYTINRVKEMTLCFQMDVDGIFTDDPPLAQRTLSQYKEESLPDL